MAMTTFVRIVEKGSLTAAANALDTSLPTVVRILATLVRPDQGYAEVAGYDVTRYPDQVRYRIGLAGQHAAVDEKLTGRDNLRMFGRLTLHAESVVDDVIARGNGVGNDSGLGE